MTKIDLDKYYTDKILAKYCIDKTYEILKGEIVTEIIENSAGNGNFSLQIPNCIAYDILPSHESIIKQNYLDLELEYKKGRLFIGNPPFSTKNRLIKQFYKKQILEGDYIAWILPISQLNNNVELYDFDLIYSENLGLQMYSDKPIHCCFNIYKRPLVKKNRPVYELKDVTIYSHYRSRKTQEYFFDSDLRICGFGNIGKICERPDQFCKEFLFIVNNPSLKEQILNTLKNADWKTLYPSISTPALMKWQIVTYLRQQIKDIK